MRVGGKCEPAGLEPIPAGVCTGSPDRMYKGSSGYRKIPGNTCSGGVQKDEKVDKKCSQGAVMPIAFYCKSIQVRLFFVAQLAEGDIIHQTVSFQSFPSVA